MLEEFLGADNLEFRIVECNNSHMQDIKDFCEKCKQEGFKNNESLSA